MNQKEMGVKPPWETESKDKWVAAADTQALQKTTVLNCAWRDIDWEKWHALLMRLWEEHQLSNQTSNPEDDSEDTIIVKHCPNSSII